MKKHVPNTITLLNLLCGCLAIIAGFNYEFEYACYLILVASLFDFLDGMCARMLGVSNPLGEQLDSLSDMVSFGLAPGLILFNFIVNLHEIQPDSLINEYGWLPYIVLCIPLFSALRLAKFNIDTRQTDSFIGLATPANAVFFIFLILINELKEFPQIIDTNALTSIIINPIFLIILSILFSILLIAEIPMFSLKLKSLKWSGNETRFIFLGLFITSILLFNISGFPIIIVTYILWSIIQKVGNKSN